MNLSKKINIIKDEKTIAGLLKIIKELDFNSSGLDLRNLSEDILSEWQKLKNSYRKKLTKADRYQLNVYEKFDAEQTIIIGLLILLNEKIINFMFQ